MGAPDLIFELRSKGYSIHADGGYLDISPADLPPDILQTIRQSKAEILAALLSEAKPDCIDTLATDYAELKTFIAELCQIVGHTEEAKANMLAACRDVTPTGIAEQRDYFKRLVELATAGRYWTSKTTH
jgi:hypothetical protein